MTKSSEAPGFYKKDPSERLDFVKNFAKLTEEEMKTISGYGALGKETANWIAEGSPSLDMFGFDIKRFPSSLLKNERWLREKCHETLEEIRENDRRS